MLQQSGQHFGLSIICLTFPSRPVQMKVFLSGSESRELSATKDSGAAAYQSCQGVMGRLRDADAVR